MEWTEGIELEYGLEKEAQNLSKLLYVTKYQTVIQGILAKVFGTKWET